MRVKRSRQDRSKKYLVSLVSTYKVGAKLEIKDDSW